MTEHAGFKLGDRVMRINGANGKGVLPEHAIGTVSRFVELEETQDEFGGVYIELKEYPTVMNMPKNLKLLPMDSGSREEDLRPVIQNVVRELDKAILITIGAACMSVGILIGRQTVFNDIVIEKQPPPQLEDWITINVAKLGDQQ